MTTEKQVKEKVDFHGPEEFKSPKNSRRTKCIVGVVTLALLLVSAVISLTVFLLIKPRASQMLVDIDLKEGETFIYRVDQKLEVTGHNVQKDTITSIVGIQVVNKTSDAYWFLLKVKTEYKDKNGKVKAKSFGYFRVRLHTKPQRLEKAENEIIEPYELHGSPHTDGEFIRYLHGVLYQLLPAVRRDLYENVDGQKDNNLKPENSSSLPGPIRMHRKADTKRADKVLIKNHFDGSDLVNSSLDMDLDVKYADSAAINKSSGMVSESNIYLFERLNFGEPIKTKDGHNVTMMSVVLYSYMTRVEMDSTSFFNEDEIKASKIHLFVKLDVPTKSRSIVDINKDTTTAAPTSSNLNSSNDSVVIQELSTEGPNTVTIGRNRRSLDGGDLHSSNLDATHKRRFRREVPQMLKGALQSLNIQAPIDRSFSIFNKNVIGVKIEAKNTFWLKGNLQSWSLGSDLKLNVGNRRVSLYGVEYTREEIEQEKKKGNNRTWKKGIPLCYGVLFIQLCAEFSLSCTIETPSLAFVPEETSLSPIKFAFEVKVSAEVTASMEAYVSLLLVRAGVFADGTIIRASLPAKLSYNSVKPKPNFCMSAHATLTALELHAGLFYQRRRLWSWGDRHTMKSFGTWGAIARDWELFKSCF